MVVKAGKEYPLSKFPHTIIPVRAEHTAAGIVDALQRFCGAEPPRQLQMSLGKIVSKKLSFPQKGRAKKKPRIHSVHLVFVDDASSIPQAVKNACSFLKIDTKETGVILKHRHVGNSRQMHEVAEALSSELAGAHIYMWER